MAPVRCTGGTAPWSARRRAPSAAADAPPTVLPRAGSTGSAASPGHSGSSSRRAPGVAAQQSAPVLVTRFLVEHHVPVGADTGRVAVHFAARDQLGTSRQDSSARRIASTSTSTRTPWSSASHTTSSHVRLVPSTCNPRSLIRPLWLPAAPSRLGQELGAHMAQTLEPNTAFADRHAGNAQRKSMRLAESRDRWNFGSLTMKTQQTRDKHAQHCVPASPRTCRSALPRSGLGPSLGRDLRCGRTAVLARPAGGPIVGQAVASRGSLAHDGLRLLPCGHFRRG